LLGWVSEGLKVEQSGLDQLAVDGQHLLFSALNPGTGGVILRVRTFPLVGFYLIVIAAGVAIGLVLVRATLNRRLVVVAALLALLVLLAVFTPALARALVNDAVAGAAALVLILWFAWDVVVRVPRWRKANPPARPRPRGPLPRSRVPAAPAPAAESESSDEA
jgi:hypothetical protein